MRIMWLSETVLLAAFTVTCGTALGKPEYVRPFESAYRGMGYDLSCMVCHVEPGADYHNDYGATVARLLGYRDASPIDVSIAIKEAEYEPSLYEGKLYGDLLRKGLPPAYDREKLGLSKVIVPSHCVSSDELFARRAPVPDIQVLLTLTYDSRVERPSGSRFYSDRRRRSRNNGAVPAASILSASARESASMRLRQLGLQVAPSVVDTLLMRDDFLRGRAAAAVGLVSPEVRRWILAEVCPRLQRAIRSDQVERRKSAVDSVRSLGRYGEPLFLQVVECLKDPDPAVRAAAARAVGDVQAEHARSVPLLIAALKDPHWIVRYRAAEALAKFGETAERAVPALRESLKDAEWQVVVKAAESLCVLGTAARPALADILESIASGSYMSPRWNQAEVLAAVVGKDRPDELVDLLEHKDSSVSAAASRLLVATKPSERIVDRLISLCEPGRANALRLRAASTLGTLKPIPARAARGASSPAFSARIKH